MKRRNLLKGLGAAALLSPTLGHSSMDKLMNTIPEDKLETAKTVVQNATSNGKLKIALGMVGNQDGPLMMDSSGFNGPQSTVPIGPDTIFNIASMTKLVTTIAALQLVESGKIELDAPVNTYLPEMEGLKVLLGFDNAGDPFFEDAVRAPTSRELITHTSGYVYPFWNENAFMAQEKGLVPNFFGGGSEWLQAPLAFQPGTKWEYGIGIDWLGVLVEKISGKRLMEYFFDHIFKPLGMLDTFYEFPADKLDRSLGILPRIDGILEAPKDAQPKPSAPGSMDFYSGGGGLYSTMKDYGRIMTVMLNNGSLDGVRILKPETVEMMFQNQIGDLALAPIETQMPSLSNNCDLGFGSNAKWGLGFAIHPEGTRNGRSPGSASWAGLFNSYFWIDRQANIFGIVATQVLPFADDYGLLFLTDFERAVYGK